MTLRAGGIWVPPGNLNQGGDLYKYRKFIKLVDGWVDRIADPALGRAWDVVKECVAAHAVADREEGQSLQLARALAWTDFADALRGGECTYTMAGMAQELFSAGEDIGMERQLEEVIAEAHFVAKGGGPAWEMVADDEGNQIPVLMLVWDRDLEDVEH